MRACNGCRKRKIKCDSATTNIWPCSACTRLKLVCIPPSIDQDSEPAAHEQILDFSQPAPAAVSSALPPPPAPAPASAASTSQIDTTSQPFHARDCIRPQQQQQPQQPHQPHQYLTSPTDDGRFYNPSPVDASHGQLQHAFHYAQHPQPPPPQPSAQVHRNPPPPFSVSTPQPIIQVSEPAPQTPTNSSDLTNAFNELKIDETGIAPYINQESKDHVKPQTALAECERSLPSLYNGANSSLQFPAELMPSDTEALEYFKVYFDDLHPYDLELHEHYQYHAEGRLCGYDTVECLIRTRVWQTILVVEIMVGGPQGRSDFGVETDTVEVRPSWDIPNLDAYEVERSRQFSYFVHNALNIRRIVDVFHKVKKTKDWGANPQFARNNPLFEAWYSSLPPDLMVTYPPDGSPPWIPSHFVANMHSHFELAKIMLHRPQFVAASSFPAGGEWRHHFSICYSSAKALCRLQEALISSFGVSGFLCMQRGINFSIYCILTSVMLHLVAITSPDPEFNKDSRSYFTRHMRSQLAALRLAFSADTNKPFELKPTFPYGSPVGTIVSDIVPSGMHLYHSPSTAKTHEPWIKAQIDEDYVNGEIRDLCGSLIEVRNDREKERSGLLGQFDTPQAYGTIHLVHASVKEYLHLKFASAGDISSPGKLSPGAASLAMQHSVLAKTCVRYLTYSEVWDRDVLPDFDVPIPTVTNKPSGEDDDTAISSYGGSAARKAQSYEQGVANIPYNQLNYRPHMRTADRADELLVFCDT
ncbi:hypothetical protein MGYG_04981 [Nannizzia gypsea CBS 118893]|uniref:Zn(2)-C6 fungal-type domain-containing protein n=1 Tax=Arthroderma gypseum (strain ATCC MYA-4604 / CBS 118893) TaxID=535722 RepID=E4UXY6_ARTGP|nr:hypothetical protein MGYG_04981 [Nannizzia gypsea CBS 118893]EFR01979.1 hypothetical protein MGYG_04981 [Nannizzia gypsea CBS 118893]